MAELSAVTSSESSHLFANENGLSNTKIDTRAVIFQDKIFTSGQLMALRRCQVVGGVMLTNLWRNTLKEVKEAALTYVQLERVIAIQDRENTINQFLLTRFVRFFHYKGSSLQKFRKTIASGYFACDNLPDLAESKTTKEQIAMCFTAYHDENWKTLID